jgi:hypothetical protein
VRKFIAILVISLALAACAQKQQAPTKSDVSCPSRFMTACTSDFNF